MSIKIVIRRAALVALFAGILPAPAHAQFGFIKKQIKEKIVHTLVDSAVSKMAGIGADSARAPAGATVPSGARVGAQPGPHFDELVVEMTPRSLDGLEKYLKAQKEQRASGRATSPALAAGFTPDPKMVQYGLMTQRALAFCTAAAPQGATGAAVSAMAVANDLQGQYTPVEMASLRPRCSRLLSLLGNTQSPD